MKVAVLADAGMAQRFLIDALDAIEGCEEISLFSCTNTRSRKNPVRHAGYYLLNLLMIRRASPVISVSQGRKRLADSVEFASEYDGAWQALPPEILERLRQGGFDVVLKIGMGLLRVPPREQLSVPILSYHHGDPDRYRGRPAGFWEVDEGAPVMGQIIQVITNRLDAGHVVAYAETKVSPWSYRRTLAESYRHSPLLINPAIRNALSGTFLKKPCRGRNRRLPSNATSLRFAAKLAVHFVTHLCYGAFFEKRWIVSTAPLSGVELPAPIGSAEVPPLSDWNSLAVAKGYTFYADPFFSCTPPGILVEALNAKSGVGEIMLIAGREHRRVSTAAGHISYPSTAVIDGHQIVVPETAQWSGPMVHALSDRSLTALHPLRIEGGPRILDPTLFAWDGRIYLFGNIASIGPGALYLWSAEAIDGTFALHPASPVRISPEGSRMAGSLIKHDGRIFRLGQDFTRAYGDGILAFEVEALSAESYSERAVGSVRFRDRRGPHTLNFRSGEMLFDWYQDRFSLLAGVRRLVGRTRASYSDPSTNKLPSRGAVSEAKIFATTAALIITSICGAPMG